MNSPDARLRDLERTCASDPLDLEQLDRYLSGLRRTGRDTAVLPLLERAFAAAPQRAALRARYARALARAGRLAEACDLYAIRWEADPELAFRRYPLELRGQRVLLPELIELTSPDLRAFDPVALAEHFPRRADGRFRLNTTRMLQRYRVHEEGAPHRRLQLIAWSPGTASLIDRPQDRGKSIVTVGIETRSTQARTLKPHEWRG